MRRNAGEYRAGRKEGSRQEQKVGKNKAEVQKMNLEESGPVSIASDA